MGRRRPEAREAHFAESFSLEVIVRSLCNCRRDKWCGVQTLMEITDAPASRRRNLHARF
jgi:hypothetical protein